MALCVVGGGLFVFGIGHHRHFSTFIAHHAICVVGGGVFCQSLAPFSQLAVAPPHFRPNRQRMATTPRRATAGQNPLQHHDGFVHMDGVLPLPRLCVGVERLRHHLCVRGDLDLAFAASLTLFYMQISGL